MMKLPKPYIKNDHSDEWPRKLQSMKFDSAKFNIEVVEVFRQRTHEGRKRTFATRHSLPSWRRKGSKAAGAKLRRSPGASYDSENKE